MNKFAVTFTEKSKYNPMTRTIHVEIDNAFLAERIILQKFGRTKVDINKVEEVKKEVVSE